MEIALQIPQVMKHVVRVVIASSDNEVLSHLETATEKVVDVSVSSVSSLMELVDHVRSLEVDIVIVDDQLQQSAGFIKRVRKEDPHLSIIAVIDGENTSVALDRIREGANNCITIADCERSAEVIRRTIEERSLRYQSKRLREQLLSNHLDHPEAFADIISVDPQMHSVFLFAEVIARTNAPILLTGETGTGKDLLARAIHRVSGREGRIVTENVAGVDDSLFSDTLFGHTDGAFTGTAGSRGGLLDEAKGGTLFLDEIGDLEPQTQVKLLRLVEYGEYYPIGSDQPLKSDARFIVATHRELGDLMTQGSFRSDLYYRLATHKIHLPPLRNRPRDIPLLFNHFVTIAAAEYDGPAMQIEDEVMSILTLYSFPGNIRELRAVAFFAVNKCVNVLITPEDIKGFSDELDRHITEYIPAPVLVREVEFYEQLPTIDRITDLLIDEALRRAEGNQSRAAAMIGITPSAVSKRLKRRRRFE